MEHMDVDVVIEETTRDAAAEADRIAASRAAKDATVEVGKTAAEEATKESIERAGEETDDHTDGIPAAGAPGATSVIEPPATGETNVEDQPSTSEAPSSSKYLKVGDNLSINCRARQILEHRLKGKPLMKKS
jgi:hypothetical protein